MVNPPNNEPTPPIGPTPNQPVQPSPSSAAPPHYGSGGQVQAKPIKWLGMQFSGKEAQQLWGILIQNINNEIQKCSAKALKAIKKLGKSSTGQDTDDD